MSIWTGYMLGYDAGESAAESSRQLREIGERVLYGIRRVEVDQSYLDQLHNTIRDLRSCSDHNYEKGNQFYHEALEWKAKTEQFRNEALYWRDLAQGHERRAKALEAKVAEALAYADDAVAAERAVHQTTHEQKQGLDLFRLMATWLIDAHIAGRSDRPEFAELRDIAKSIADSIERGETFRGYQKEPEKMARLNELLRGLYKS